MTTNKDNFLLENSYVLTINKFPNVVYYCQGVNIPSIEVSDNSITTPFGDITQKGSISYGMVTITFKVDENLVGYKELANWIKSISLDGNFNTQTEFQSDGTLSILTNNNTSNIRIKLLSMVPLDLSGLPFGTNAEDPLQLIATCMFKIMRYEFEE